MTAIAGHCCPPLLAQARPCSGIGELPSEREVGGKRISQLLGHLFAVCLSRNGDGSRDLKANSQGARTSRVYCHSPSRSRSRTKRKERPNTRDCCQPLRTGAATYPFLRR